MNPRDYTSRGIPKVLDHIAGQFLDGIRKDLKQNRNPLFSSTPLKGEDSLFLQTIGDAVNIIEEHKIYFGKIDRRSVVLGALLADQLRTDSRQGHELDIEREKGYACANIKQILPPEYFEKIRPDLSGLMGRVTSPLGRENNKDSSGLPTRLPKSEIESLLRKDADLTTSLEEVEDICYFVADLLSAPEAREVINGILGLTDRYEKSLIDLSRRLRLVKEPNSNSLSTSITYPPVEFIEPELGPEETPELFDTE